MSTLSGLSQTLVFDGVLDEKKAHEILSSAKSNKHSFVKELLNQSILAPEEIAEIASKNFGAPFLDIDELDTHELPINLVPENLIIKHQILPLKQRANILFIAVGDPSQQSLFTELRFNTGYHIRVVVAEAHKLEKIIDQIINEKNSCALHNYLGEDTDNFEVDIQQDETEVLEDDQGKDDAPIVRFVQKILLDAISRGASDIHFEPYEDTYRVRFRIDGLLYEVASPPVQHSSRLASRLKILSNLDISERRIPQDGRFKLKVTAKRSVEFRISTCPVVNGEKVVMRILDPAAAGIGIDSLGFDEQQRQLFVSAIQEPQGMVLVTGPTGSGKTVTLYTALNILNTSEKNISTAEDPVEIKLKGVNQVNINPKTGLHFSTALRSFLRQDPDIIMVGEMRDLETAEIGIKAAQTGHLVLSTLHTNSAPESLTRLANMGVEPFNIATSVNLVMAQRLARKLCDKCRIQEPLPDETLKKLGIDDNDRNKIFQPNPSGCKHCTMGYKGRIGIFEVLHFTQDIAEVILRGGNAYEIAEVANSQGMVTLKKSGLNKVIAGLTSLAEVNRITKD